MAHECSCCGGDCYCHGDIDDCIVSLTPASCRGCEDCNEEEEDLPDWDDEDDDLIPVSPDEAEPVTASDVCRECGCHTYMACLHPAHGTCWWSEHATQKDGAFVGPLCSHCAMKLENVIRPWKDNGLGDQTN